MRETFWWKECTFTCDDDQDGVSHSWFISDLKAGFEERRYSNCVRDVEHISIKQSTKQRPSLRVLESSLISAASGRKTSKTFSILVSILIVKKSSDITLAIQKKYPRSWIFNFSFSGVPLWKQCLTNWRSNCQLLLANSPRTLCFWSLTWKNCLLAVENSNEENDLRKDYRSSRLWVFDTFAFCMFGISQLINLFLHCFHKQGVN
jgi:hypothetical protein